jgi:hypothetical protein
MGYRNALEIVESAIYWAERNDAHLPSYPSPLRNRKEFKAWVKSKGYYAIIFSHAWAKKFYGDAWKYHLAQQLSYRENGRHAPLKYIEKFGL